MDTRGIMRPAAVDRMFTLARPAPPPDLAHLVDRHWVVTWDLRGRPPFRSEVMPHPAVHLVFEPHGAAVHGVPRGRFDRVLSGTGWALATKFLPAGFAPFAGRPMHELTGKVVELGTLFGVRGERLERAVNAADGQDERLALLHAFLRARLPADPDPKAELVDARGRAGRVSESCGGPIRSANRARRRRVTQVARGEPVGPRERVAGWGRQARRASAGDCASSARRGRRRG